MNAYCFVCKVLMKKSPRKPGIPGFEPSTTELKSAIITQPLSLSLYNSSIRFAARRLGTWNVSTSPAGGFLCMMGLSAILEWTFDYRWMTNDVRPERPTATTSSPPIPGLWAASPAVWGYAAMAEAYEMKVMWRAVSTTFTFRQQRLTKVILYKLRGKLSNIIS